MLVSNEKENNCILHCYNFNNEKVFLEYIRLLYNRFIDNHLFFDTGFNWFSTFYKFK